MDKSKTIVTYLNKLDKEKKPGFALLSLKNHWIEQKAILGFHYHSLTNLLYTAERPNKREQEFMDFFMFGRSDDFEIPNAEVPTEAITTWFSFFLSSGYKAPEGVSDVIREICMLYYCIDSLSSGETEEIPISVQLTLDRVLVGLTGVASGVFATCLLTGFEHDDKLYRTGKTQKSALKRKVEKDTPIIIGCLNKFIDENGDKLSQMVSYSSPLGT